MDIFYEEESEKIAFPYYLVEYVDDERKIHLAVVQDMKNVLMKNIVFKMMLD